jgi:hypothetical protein
MLKTPLAPQPVPPEIAAVANRQSARDLAREGWLCAGTRDLLGALQSFERALDRDVDCYEAWLGLSKIFVDLNDTRRAICCLDVARLLKQRGVS